MKKVLEALAQMQVKMSFSTVLLILLIAFMVSLIIYFTYKRVLTSLYKGGVFLLSTYMLIN